MDYCLWKVDNQPVKHSILITLPWYTCTCSSQYKTALLVVNLSFIVLKVCTNNDSDVMYSCTLNAHALIWDNYCMYFVCTCTYMYQFVLNFKFRYKAFLAEKKHSLRLFCSFQSINHSVYYMLTWLKCSLYEVHLTFADSAMIVLCVTMNVGYTGLGCTYGTVAIVSAWCSCSRCTFTCIDHNNTTICSLD